MFEWRTALMCPFHLSCRATTLDWNPGLRSSGKNSCSFDFGGGERSCEAIMGLLERLHNVSDLIVHIRLVLLQPCGCTCWQQIQQIFRVTGDVMMHACMHAEKLLSCRGSAIPTQPSCHKKRLRCPAGCRCAGSPFNQVVSTQVKRHVALAVHEFRTLLLQLFTSTAYYKVDASGKI